MIVIMRAGATPAEIEHVTERVSELGYQVHLSRGTERTIIGIIGDERPLDPALFEVMDGVERTVGILPPFRLASREFRPDNTVIRLGNVTIGGQRLHVMAGPCSVESREQLLETAHAVKEAGATLLRGGAYKPRTSPYSFQGMGLKGLEILAEAREETGLYIVTEVMSPDKVPLVAEYADVLQVGARNMQNYDLLKAVGKSQKPVLLKRGMMSMVEELLMSAEYIMASGNYNIMLCERGIRTFETYTRNTTDINAIPALKHLSHLPVIGDPSHGTGKWALVAPVAKALVAAGADGLMIEVHHSPEHALSDGAQSLKPERFAELMHQVKLVAEAVGRAL